MSAPRRHLSPVFATLVSSSLMLGGCRDWRGVQPRPDKSERREAAPIASVAPPLAMPPVQPGTVDVAALVSAVQPAVVSISTVHESRESAAEPFGGLFGPSPRGDRVRRERALGSGFIISTDGRVVTNAHVVEQASDVRVLLADEREFKATVRGRDRKLDLAVLELDGAKDLPTVTLGSSDALRVGEYVVAIGNPFGLGHTVTMGIVSAKGRAIGAGPYDDFIQTDTSINPGNSGGPLFNLRGEVVGINTAISAHGQGIGFASPVDTLKRIVAEMVETGHVARARLGVGIQRVDATLAKALDMESPRGALVTDIEKGGPADVAGVRVGDVILRAGEAEVVRAEDLSRLVAGNKPGAKLSLQVLREGNRRTLEVTLAELQEEEEPEIDEHDPAPGKPRGGLIVDDAPGGGALIRGVYSRSVFADHLLPGDVIVEVNKKPIPNGSALRSELSRAKRGEPVLLKVQRNGRTRFVAIEPP